MLGTGLGGIVAGLMVRYLPAPTHLVYVVLGVVFVAQAAGVLAMAETAAPRPGALASLKPRVAVPPAVRPTLLLAVPAVVAIWSLARFYGSLGPTLVRNPPGRTRSSSAGWRCSCSPAAARSRCSCCSAGRRRR